MQHANIIEDRDGRPDAPETADQTSARIRIERLLHRYPNISEEELSEVLQFLAKGKHLDVGAVAGADEFGDKVAEIRRRHRRYFRPKLHEMLLFLIVVAGPPVALMAKYLLL